LFPVVMSAPRFHAAPGSQIKSAGAPLGRKKLCPVSFGLPGLYFFSQTFQGLRASRSPLATICRACGALTTIFPTRINDVRAGGALWVPKRRRRGRWAGVLSAAGAVDGSQGQVRAQRARCPWITDKKRASPGGATDTLARFCRPSRRPVLLFSNVPGATRFALAPGYHLPRLRRWLRPSAAPAALVTTICRACGALTTEL
jgi:hypothetical protein